MLSTRVASNVGSAPSSETGASHHDAMKHFSCALRAPGRCVCGLS
jgi:hypothetical protein